MFCRAIRTKNFRIDFVKNTKKCLNILKRKIVILTFAIKIQTGYVGCEVFH